MTTLGYRTSAAIVALALITACASTETGQNTVVIGDTPAHNTADTAPETVFSPKEDGGVTHNWSNAACPSNLAGFSFQDTTVFKEDGSDVACQYEDAEAGRQLTVYFSKFGDKFNAREHAQSAAQSIQQRWPTARFDEEASQACSINIGLISGIVRAANEDTKGKNTTINVGGAPCYVFSLPSGPTLVAVQVFDPWHVKVRITATNPNDTAERLATRAGETLSTERQAISGVGGEAALIYKEMRDGEDKLPPAPSPNTTET